MTHPSWSGTYLEHLRKFVVVAEELNFSQAARKLHIAASPLSQRIKDLEHELKQQLFERSTHRVSLTPAGAALLPLARDVLERFNAIPWKVREASTGRRAPLLLGMPAGVHPLLRERVIALSESVEDRYDLQRWPGVSADLVAAVIDGRLALTLARMPITDPALEVLPVMTERLGAAVPADQFEGVEDIALTQLTELSYLPPPGDGNTTYFTELDSRLDTAGIKKRIRLNTTDYAGITELISSGIAFSLTMLDPRSPMHRYAMDNVAVLPVTELDAALVTALTWRKDRATGDIHELVTAARTIFTAPITV
ncbi:MAG TPA: LysR family transcriptional regulator [Pseudonocardiaceae bacterium]|jgi:DNA-binding transcriptional LysR family regulator|nr:LysR family transcriptional regulator [Pseudonocardiaceae bacterium]